MLDAEGLLTTIGPPHDVVVADPVKEFPKVVPDMLVVLYVDPGITDVLTLDSESTNAKYLNPFAKVNSALLNIAISVALFLLV